MYQLTTKTISMSFYKLSNRFEVILRCAQNVTLLSKQHHVTLQQPRVTLQKPRVTLQKPCVMLQKPRVTLQKPRATLQTPHYSNYTTPQLQLHYNYNYSCTTPHYIQQWVRWPTRWPLQPLQLMDHTAPSTFRSISGTALCGTTGVTKWLLVMKIIERGIFLPQRCEASSPAAGEDLVLPCPRGGRPTKVWYGDLVKTHLVTNVF